MNIEKATEFKLLEETIGVPIEIISNDFTEVPGYENSVNTSQEIVFQIKEEEPDSFAAGVLFTLSLMSFSFAATFAHAASSSRWMAIVGVPGSVFTIT